MVVTDASRSSVERSHRWRSSWKNPPGPRATDPRPSARSARSAARRPATMRVVALTWAVVALVLAVFAPKVETALSGAGWQANGSESVQARALIQRNFGGLSSAAPVVVVHSFDARHRRTRELRRRHEGQAIRAPTRASPPSSRRVPGRGFMPADGHTALIVGGARRDPTAMVAAADSLKGKLHALSSGATDDLHRRVRHVVGLQCREPQGDDEVEIYSWPVTLAILVLAFGSLVAAGLPLLLTMLGLLAWPGTSRCSRTASRSRSGR